MEVCQMDRRKCLAVAVTLHVVIELLDKEIVLNVGRFVSKHSVSEDFVLIFDVVIGVAGVGNFLAEVLWLQIETNKVIDNHCVQFDEAFARIRLHNDRADINKVLHVRRYESFVL